MKIIKETNRIILYETKDEDLMIGLKYYIDETILKDNSVCDFCNSSENIFFYLFPELGSNALCHKCATDYMKRAQWYQEDMHTVFNQLLVYIIKYIDKDINQLDKQLINKYFNSHSNRKLDIETFI